MINENECFLTDRKIGDSNDTTTILAVALTKNVEKLHQLKIFHENNVFGFWSKSKKITIAPI